MNRFQALSVVALILATPVFAAEEDTFKSVTLGIEVTKPASWHYLTAEQNRENLERIQLSSEELQQLVLKYSQDPMVAMTKYPEPYDDLNPSLKINSRPYGQLKGTDAKALLKMIAGPFKNMFPDFEIVDGPKDVTVSGIASGYMRMHYSLQIPDGRKFPTTSELWIVPKGDYFFMIGAGTRQDEKTGSRKEVAEIVKSIKIEN